MFSGSIAALITPYIDNKIDVDGLTQLCKWHMESGTTGLVICGSTGEANFLSPDERDTCIKTAMEAVNGQIPIIVGCGASSTDETLKMVRHAESCKADAVLIVTPAYVKPSQEGIYKHFAFINNCTEIPILVYNNPGRSGADISIDTMLRLFDLKNVVGLKDSSPDITRATLLSKKMDSKICLLSGDDPTCAAYLLAGGHGMISVTANIAPRMNQNLYEAFINKDLNQLQDFNAKMADLFAAMFMETNPQPVKFGVHMIHNTQNTLRLPLMPVAFETEETIARTMRKLGLI